MLQSAVREEFYDSVRVFWLDADDVTSVLKERAHGLVASGCADKVILFGSLAEGRAVPGSDADILVLVPCGREDEGDLFDEISRHFAGIGVPVDLFVLGVEDRKNPLARVAMERGIVLASR